MRKIYLAVILAVIFFTESTAQCMLYPVSLQNRVNNSSLIIEGRVLAKKSFWNKEKNFIYTSNLIEISKVIKGTCKTDKLEIITNGGEIDLTKIVTEPALQLSAEETGVFLLHSNGSTSQFGYPVF